LLRNVAIFANLLAMRYFSLFHEVSRVFCCATLAVFILRPRGQKREISAEQPGFSSMMGNQRSVKIDYSPARYGYFILPLVKMKYFR